MNTMTLQTKKDYQDGRTTVAGAHVEKNKNQNAPFFFHARTYTHHPSILIIHHPVKIITKNKQDN
jgi:hypothetical protein